MEYDPGQLALPLLLELFFTVIDPASLNRQGNDVGTQYRTGIYYTDEQDEETVEVSLCLLRKRISGPVIIEAKRLENYNPAEEHHQKYLDKNPDGYCHIGPDQFDALRAALQKPPFL